MATRILFCITVVSVLVLTNVLTADNYFDITDFWHAPGTTDYYRLWSGDTLDGPIRSNDTIAIMQSPVFRDLVISTANQFIRGSGYDPQFLGPDPIFNADSFAFPEQALMIRSWAQEQGHFFDPAPFSAARVVVQDHTLRITWGQAGTPFDTTEFEIYTLEDSSVVFFDCQVQISGEVTGELILGASGDIALEDNIKYSCVDDLLYPMIPADCPSKLALVSEGSILVLDTPANGHNNSGGLGNAQTNQGQTSIVITGMLAALGEQFSFENQNDVGDEFQGPSPDNRGKIHLRGSVMQRYRGYQHRSNHSSTGYLKDYHYDNRLRDWDFGVYNNYSMEHSPNSLNFGEVEVEDTLLQTVTITKLHWGVLVDSVDIAAPFFVSQIVDIPDGKEITVGFRSFVTGVFADTMVVHMEYFEIRVPLSGIATPFSDANDHAVLPQSFTLSAYPNPFNPKTKISIELTVPADVQLDVFDLQGRLVENLLYGSLSAGSHEVAFDGANLSGGVYFARLSAGANVKTAKLLLLK